MDAVAVEKVTLGLDMSVRKLVKIPGVGFVLFIITACKACASVSPGLFVKINSSKGIRKFADEDGLKEFWKAGFFARRHTITGLQCIIIALYINIIPHYTSKLTNRN